MVASNTNGRLETSPYSDLPLDLSIHKRTEETEPCKEEDLSNQNIFPWRTLSPDIILQPKEEWNYRGESDYHRNSVPCIRGDGPQRTPIKISLLSVLSYKSSDDLYLGVKVSLVDEDTTHPVKIIIPQSGVVKQIGDEIQFIVQNESETYDRETGQIYLRITSRDFSLQEKYVYIKMYNRKKYASNKIFVSCDSLEGPQRTQCRLGFWFCRRIGSRYIPISDETFSTIIKDIPKSYQKKTYPLPTMANFIQEESIEWQSQSYSSSNKRKRTELDQIESDSE